RSDQRGKFLLSETDAIKDVDGNRAHRRRRSSWLHRVVRQGVHQGKPHQRPESDDLQAFDQVHLQGRRRKKVGFTFSSSKFQVCNLQSPPICAGVTLFVLPCDQRRTTDDAFPTVSAAQFPSAIDISLSYLHSWFRRLHPIERK